MTPSVIVAAIVAIIAIGVGAIVILSNDKGQGIGVVVAIISPTVVALIALLRTVATERKVEDVRNKLNGHIEEE